MHRRAFNPSETATLQPTPAVGLFAYSDRQYLDTVSMDLLQRIALNFNTQVDMTDHAQAEQVWFNQQLTGHADHVRTVILKAATKAGKEEMQPLGDLLSTVTQLYIDPQNIDLQKKLAQKIEEVKGKPRYGMVVAGALVAFAGAVMVAVSIAAIAISFGLFTPPALIGIVVGTCIAAKAVAVVCAALGTIITLKGLSMAAQHAKRSGSALIAHSYLNIVRSTNQANPFKKSNTAAATPATTVSSTTPAPSPSAERPALKP